MSNGEEILDLLRQGRPGYHPLVSLVELSQHEDAGVAEKIKCHSEIAKYVCSQKKAVEAKVDLSGELGVINITIDNGDGEEPLSYES